MRLRICLSILSLATGLACLRAADAAPRALLLDAAVVGSDVVAVGERGNVFRSSDNGRTWQTASSLATATLTGISFAPDGSRGWAVGHDALVLTSADAGRTWQKQWQGENITDSFLDVLALDANRVIAVGAYGLFLATADGGKTWSRRKVLADELHLNRINRGPGGTLYLAGERGTLLRSVDDGATWTPIPAPYDGSFYGVLALDKRTLIAHGLRGRVYRSIDDGTTWDAIATPAPALLAASVKLKSNFILLGGHARALLLSRDYGKTFAPLADPLPSAVAELIETPDGHLLALGEAGATVLAAPK